MNETDTSLLLTFELWLFNRPMYRYSMELYIPLGSASEVSGRDSMTRTSGRRGRTMGKRSQVFLKNAKKIGSAHSNPWFSTIFPLKMTTRCGIRHFGTKAMEFWECNPHWCGHPWIAVLDSGRLWRSANTSEISLFWGGFPYVIHHLWWGRPRVTKIYPRMPCSGLPGGNV